MATVYDATARGKLHARIAALTADSRPRWGKMTVGRMVAHCDLHLRHSLGEHLTPVNKPIRFFPLNLLIIYVLPTPKSVPTMNELREPVSGVFEEDVERLKATLEKLGAVPRGTRMPVHAAFGTIGHHAHGTLAHNHLAHHLTQFGV
ncbi:MAG: hypothetical protein K8S98_02380 [Planctomycetes bacterium]|nr:hypothetical protein [Planctomycetota bacterium]